MTLVHATASIVVFIALVARVPSAASFTTPVYGVGSLFFPVRKTVVTGVSDSDTKRQDLAEVGAFFVDAFWTAKVGGGARELSSNQRQVLEQSQTAEFTKRYGKRQNPRNPPTADLLILRDASSSSAVTESTMIACAGVEVARIPLTSGVLNEFSSDDEYAPLMSNLAVSRSYRRRGVAEQMVQAVERLVRLEWGYTSCYLYVEERNKAAVALYQKLGYRRVFRDGNAKTLLPTVSGGLQSADTVIVCMKKSLYGNLWQRWFP